MAPTQRLQWLDAMRGFTMILVVMCHVMTISFNVDYKTSICQRFFILFRMPLFFFVSGFLAYKAKNIWTGTFFISQLKKKLIIQIVPALIFFTIFICLSFKNIPSAFIENLRNPTKGGYWFTWSLLHMFCIYYLTEYLIEKSKCWTKHHINMNIVLGILWIISVAMYVKIYVPYSMWKMIGEPRAFLDISSLIKTIQFFQFFLLGNIVHRNWQKITRLIDRRFFYPVIILIALVATSEFIVWHNIRFAWKNIPGTIAMYSLLIIVVCFFRNYERWFTKDTRIGRAMQYIGTRTLDIYLLHFLFLPKMPEIGKLLSKYGNSFIIDFTCGLSISLLIIAFCLIVSNILRVSPFLSELLFGRKVITNK